MSNGERYTGNQEQDNLWVCFHCGDDKVYPLDFKELGYRRWRLILRCPECEARREATFGYDEVISLDAELEKAEDEIKVAIKEYTKKAMTEVVESGIYALENDLILPSDF